VGGGVFSKTNSVVNHCVIENNSATNDGGVLTVCAIAGNDASEGGGVYGESDGFLYYCSINGNTATDGGGVYLWDDGELFNCTIATNYASVSGGGIVCSNKGTVVNSIIYDNQAALEKNNWQSYTTNVTFSYCCTTPLTGLPGGSGCISENPLFVAPGLDYHLINGSPCIDAGTNMAWMTTATDLDGNPRIHDGIVDMGCYEFIPEPGLGIWIFGILVMRNIMKIRRCA